MIQARQGDQAALTELYRLYEHKAYNVALRMLGNPWDAADVTQEAFIKAFGALDQFRGEARFSTWLHRIVVNAVRDHLRKRQMDPMEDEELDRVASMNSPAAGGRLVGGRDTALDPVTDGLSEPLLAALQALDERFRLAVVLCDLLGFDYAEAANILEVREGTIKSRIFRARAELASRLRGAGYEPSTRPPRTEEERLGTAADATTSYEQPPE
ncbi:MAG: sigma-70 family RNA polymerase sigma factor [Actinobacteria bacterium]|nr:sigma-70 family RNA polymerase sigma factor [Actinomycetota bacterium]